MPEDEYPICSSMIFRSMAKDFRMAMAERLEVLSDKCSNYHAMNQYEIWETAMRKLEWFQLKLESYCSMPQENKERFAMFTPGTRGISYLVINLSEITPACSVDSAIVDQNTKSAMSALEAAKLAMPLIRDGFKKRQQQATCTQLPSSP
jgi:hypothetical protein